MRTCTVCKELKDDSLFYKHHSIKPNGIRARCDDCRNLYRRKAHLKDSNIKRGQSNSWNAKNREKLAKLGRDNRKKDPRRFKGYSLKSDFNLSIEEYDALLQIQNGLCAICKKPETSKHQSGKVKDLAVDHSHDTNVIRGLLCWVCNTGIGKLGDSPELLREAANYIEKHKKNNNN